MSQLNVCGLIMSVRSIMRINYDFTQNKLKYDIQYIVFLGIIDMRTACIVFIFFLLLLYYIGKQKYKIVQTFVQHTIKTIAIFVCNIE